MPASSNLIGRYSARPISFRRRLGLESFDALGTGHYMLALLELDVTDTERALEAQRALGVRVSLFAWVASCIATALAEHPQLNAARGKRHIYEFEDVDLNVPVELSGADGAAPHMLIVRRAAHKSAPEIYAEIEHAREQFAQRAAVSGEDARAQRFMRALLWLPGGVRRAVLRAATRRPLWVKRLTGTALLTSVAKFSGLRGFVVPYATGPLATSFTIGSVSDKPLVKDGTVQARRCLQLTVAFNHDLVDGAPAARFTTRLAALIESPPSAAPPLGLDQLIFSRRIG